MSEYIELGRMRDIESGGCEVWTGSEWRKLSEIQNSQDYNNAVFECLNPIEEQKIQRAIKGMKG